MKPVHLYIIGACLCDAHTRTHKRMYAHTLTHTQSHILTNTRTHAHTNTTNTDRRAYMHTHTQAHTHTNTHTNTQQIQRRVCTDARMHTIHMHLHMHTHAHPHIHTQTHTHTHTPWTKPVFRNQPCVLYKTEHNVYLYYNIYILSCSSHNLFCCWAPYCWHCYYPHNRPGRIYYLLIHISQNSGLHVF